MGKLLLSHKSIKRKTFSFYLKRNPFLCRNFHWTLFSDFEKIFKSAEEEIKRCFPGDGDGILYFVPQFFRLGGRFVCKETKILLFINFTSRPFLSWANSQILVIAFLEILVQCTWHPNVVLQLKTSELQCIAIISYVQEFSKPLFSCIFSFTFDGIKCSLDSWQYPCVCNAFFIIKDCMHPKMISSKEAMLVKKE